MRNDRARSKYLRDFLYNSKGNKHLFTLTLFVMLLSSTAFEQTVDKSSQTTSGLCSPVVRGNRNSFTFQCNGISKEQADQLLTILNKIAQNQLPADKAMEKLDEIQHSLPIGFMQFSRVHFRTNQITAGERIIFDVDMTNNGNQPVEQEYWYFEARLVRVVGDLSAADDQVHDGFRKDAVKRLAQLLDKGAQGVQVGKGDTQWLTFTIPTETGAPLAPDVAEEIKDGRVRLYVYAWARWRNAPHDLDYCASLQPPQTAETDDKTAVWHQCVR
jgi:hypothetical protein